MKANKIDRKKNEKESNIQCHFLTESVLFLHNLLVSNNMFNFQIANDCANCGSSIFLFYFHIENI